MRLYVYVEGQTEQAFVSDVLGPHLYDLGAHDVRPCLVWSKKERNRIKKGGGRNWTAARQGLLSLLGDSAPDARFTTMFDLYALFDEFPGVTEASQASSPDERVRVLEESLAADLVDHRVIPYVQLYEFEALLFADCQALGSFYEDDNRAADAQAMVDQAGSPEAINDSRETAPSKRILKLFPGHRKSIDGPAILRGVGLPRLRERCPHFDDWLKRLEAEIA